MSGTLYLSYSQLRVLKNCPHQWELQHRVRVPYERDNRNFLVGSVVHKLMEDWWKLGNCKPKWMEAFTKVYFDGYVSANKVIWRRPSDSLDAMRKVQEAVYTLEHILEQQGFVKAWLAGQMKSEHIFEIPWGQDMLRGGIDLWLTEDKEIFDLKNSANSKWFDKKQLLFYDIAVLLETGVKLKKAGIITPFHVRDHIIRYEFSDDDRRKMKDTINWAFETMRGKEFEAIGNPMSDCYMCFVKKHCKRWAMQDNTEIIREGSKKVVRL